MLKDSSVHIEKQHILDLCTTMLQPAKLVNVEVATKVWKLDSDAAGEELVFECFQDEVLA
jgi:hypothetical protein